MDDTPQSHSSRFAARTSLPFVPAALLLALFSALAVWPSSIPGLPRPPRLILISVSLAGALVWLSSRERSRRRLLARARPRTRGRPGHDDIVLATIDAIVTDPAWLHVMSGPDAARLARGVLEATGALVGSGERVLVVDGARRLRLHETIRQEGMPGLLECLAGELPLFEAIQGGGEESLCFLPRGNPMRSEVWPHLGRLLLEARPHFDRVVLALDFAVPQEAGPALAGLDAAGWWCPDESSPILASALAERIGIPLRSIRLVMPENAMHEGAGDLARVFELIPVLTNHEVSRLDRAIEEPAIEPVVQTGIVDCDLQVRERLRFLVWMRGIQAESRRELETHR